MLTFMSDIDILYRYQWYTGLGDFTFWLRLSLSRFAERDLKAKLNARIRTNVQLNFGQSMYLDHTFW